MNEEINPSVKFTIDKAQEVLEALADKMGVAAEYFWPIFVKQQMIEGVVGLVILASVLGFGFMIVKNVSETWRIDGSDVPVRKILACILVVASMVSIPTTVSCQLPKVLNPEFAAIKEVFNLVHGNTTETK